MLYLGQEKNTHRFSLICMTSRYLLLFSLLHSQELLLVFLLSLAFCILSLLLVLTELRCAIIQFNSIYLHGNLTAKGQLQSDHVKKYRNDTQYQSQNYTANSK
jgi:hypothetical protein